MTKEKRIFQLEKEISNLEKEISNLDKEISNLDKEILELSPKKKIHTAERRNKMKSNSTFTGLLVILIFAVFLGRKKLNK